MKSANDTSGASLVIDASALVRAAVDGQPEALAALRSVRRGQRRALAPDLIWAEVTNALVVRVRAGRVTVPQAGEILADLLALPIETSPMSELAAAVLPTALAHGLSAYDACHLVLAEAAEATLITADRRLAERAPRAELID